MPIYEYRCSRCHRVFEKLQGVGAGSDDVHCPHCGGSEVVRQLSTFASASTTSASSSGSLGAGCGSGGFT